MDMRCDMAGYICEFAHVARQGGNILICVQRDKVGIYFIVVHVARQGWLYQGMICDDL